MEGLTNDFVLGLSFLLTSVICRSILRILNGVLASSKSHKKEMHIGPKIQYLGRIKKFLKLDDQ